MAQPTYLIEIDFATNPDDVSRVWVDVTQYVDTQAGISIDRGRSDEQSEIAPSTLRLTLDNRDGRFTPNRTSSPYYPNVKVGKWIRVSVIWSATTYRRFTGTVNEWPSQWAGGPALYASVTITATDRLGKLGNREFNDLIIEDVLDDRPVAFFPLGEPELSLTAGDVSGNDQPSLKGAQVGSAGAIVFGQDYQAATSSTAAIEKVPTFYRGRSTAVGFYPIDASNGRYLSAPLKAPVTSSTGATIVAYVRESSSPLTTGAVASFAAPDGSWFGIDKNTGSGNVTARYYNAKTNTLSEVNSGVGMTSTGPVQYAAVLNYSTGFLTFYVNGVVTGSPASMTAYYFPSNWNRVNVGGRSKVMFRGDISYVSFYDYPLTSNVIVAQWYSAFKGSDGTGDTSTSRMTKLAGFAGLGSVTSTGSSPQPLGQQEITGNPLDAIQLVEATEDGLFFINGAGTATFRLRNDRLNRSPDATITADMLDPDSVVLRGDNFGLTNDVSASRTDGAVVRVINQASINAHGRATGEIRAVPSTDTALRVLAAWRVNVDGVQRNRITGIKVSLLNFTSIIPSLLALDLWRKLRITGLPGQAPSSSLDLIVEGWEEVISLNEWSLTFNTSPGERVDVWQIGVSGAIGTTLRIPY